MLANAQLVFRELEAAKWQPFYLLVGEEPFQAQEIAKKIKSFFIKDPTSDSFNYESFEGEALDVGAMRASLETMPGLFDGPDALRLIVCTKFDKVSGHALEVLEPYFQNPNPTTSLMLFASKVDKRKAWYKALDQRGYVVELSEPYDRDWPKWLGYFEKKCGKRIDSRAWEILVESSNRMLSLVWAELQKVATFVGEQTSITVKDMQSLASLPGGADIFEFADDVISHRPYPAMKKFYSLLQGGESEVKILSILVRQFRQVEQCQYHVQRGITQAKLLAPKIGAHPFFVTKIIEHTKRHTPEGLQSVLHQLAECDYQLKTGGGGVFDGFLVSYFHKDSTQ